MEARISFVTRVSTLLRVILGLDPGIRCMRKPVKRLRGDETRRGTTSAVPKVALRIPGSSPRMTRGGEEAEMKTAGAAGYGPRP